MSATSNSPSSGKPLLGKPLRIGVSGHRVTPKLPEQSLAPLRTQIDRLFAAFASEARADAASRHAAEIVIVSSLAEGSDRIVAEAGLAAGFTLQAILPFARAEYARDFGAAASRAEFEALLARAAEVVELDGNADRRPRAYEAAGFAMLARADLLIAIWDGEKAAGVGGTADIVTRAIAEEKLVVWIKPSSPDFMQLSRPGVEDFRATDAAAVAAAYPAR